MSQRNEPSQDSLSLENSELCSAWKTVFGSDLPRRIGPELRASILSFGHQAKLESRQFAGLDRRFATFLVPAKHSSNDAMGRVGTRLIRSWRGVRHEVTVLGNGFAYGGKIYRSLSEVARLITGARWSGPRFFGVTSQ